MKIISASRRTDIPAFYSKWFINQIKAGFCHKLNPYNYQVYRVSLQPEDCLAITFWTRNPQPLLPYLDFLTNQGYVYYFHFSINGYPKAIETNNPPIQKSIETFQKLSQKLSPNQIQWRYNPILLSNITPFSYHLEKFEFLSQKLEGYTKRCYFSFVNFYCKTERNFGKVAVKNNIKFQHPSLEEKQQLTKQLRDIAKVRGITLYSCCDDTLISEGVKKAHCIDMDIIQILRPNFKTRLKVAPTREECGCVESVDIGIYDTCGFGCQYCYATNSRNTALKRMRENNPNDTLLWRPAKLKDIDLNLKEGSKKEKKSVGSSPEYIQGKLF